MLFVVLDEVEVGVYAAAAGVPYIELYALYLESVFWYDDKFSANMVSGFILFSYIIPLVWLIPTLLPKSSIL